MSRADLDFDCAPAPVTWRTRWAMTKRSLRKAWQWVRFGKVTSKVMDTAGGGIVCEVAYFGRGGQMVGYWAYGSWDPAFPYQD